jgi:thiosulfate dehydrogenase [quinone] large subunit
MHRRAFVRGLGGALGLAAGSGVLSSAASLLAPVEAAQKTIRVPLDPIGLWLGNARALTPSQAMQYTDPATGDPALLLRLTDGRYVSYDAICPHAGCTVAYDPGRRLIICPCHDAIFDPTRNGTPISGPARQQLFHMAIRIDANGDVFALDGKPGPHVNRLHTAAPYSGQTDDDGNSSESGD